MQLPTWLIEFWNTNRGNIIASLIVGFVFFVLGPMGVWFSGRRIRQERVRKAKEALLDLLEGMLVSQENIDESKLSVLFRATEREIDVSLGTDYDIEALLEDVVLRFEKSRHLDPAQKDKYANEAQRLFQEMRAKVEKPRERLIPRPYAKIIGDLKEALVKNELPTAVKMATELEERLVGERKSEDFPLNIIRVYRRLYERNPRQFAIALALVFLVYMAIIFIFRGTFNP